MKTTIEIILDEDLQPYVEIIKKSFQTVALEFGLSRENNPSNPAFLNKERLLELRNLRVWFYKLMHQQEPVGFIAIERSKEDNTIFYIEKLAVLPEFRHYGFGRQLMDFATNEILEKGGEKVSVALIDNHVKLKEWYKTQGFIQSGIKEFNQLPFKVCFMAKELT
jgi:ribosomal protein S18 acetylase RimI-like enzyme